MHRVDPAITHECLTLDDNDIITAILIPPCEHTIIIRQLDVANSTCIFSRDTCAPRLHWNIYSAPFVVVPTSCYLSLSLVFPLFCYLPTPFFLLFLRTQLAMVLGLILFACFLPEQLQSMMIQCAKPWWNHLGHLIVSSNCEPLVWGIDTGQAVRDDDTIRHTIL